MFVLVDLDPDGIAILSTYKYGSYRLAHEDVTLDKVSRLSLPNIQWLGVKSCDISRRPVGEDSTEINSMPQFLGLMRLTTRDRIKAARMLEWDLCVEDGPEKNWRQELQKMLMLNVKAEMQVLDELPGGLVSWLSNELGYAKELLATAIPIGSNCSDDGMLF
jgi:meiotic recombination protein SPO11